MYFQKLRIHMFNTLGFQWGALNEKPSSYFHLKAVWLNRRAIRFNYMMLLNKPSQLFVGKSHKEDRIMSWGEGTDEQQDN